MDGPVAVPPCLPASSGDVAEATPNRECPEGERR